MPTDDKINYSKLKYGTTYYFTKNKSLVYPETVNRFVFPLISIIALKKVRACGDPVFGKSK